MLRSHTCGELKLNDKDKTVKLCGWVQKSRDLGGMTFIDLRDRYGITQLAFNMDIDPTLCQKARTLGREFVVQIEGKVIERSSKNTNIPTGEIEINVSELTILNKSKTPPFTIENQSDGGDDLRMKYRYLDLRRKPLQENLLLRSQLAFEVRNFLHTKKKFIEVETPFLIKSTPEGARDFVVPSRMNPGQYYALPQSPQTFKQLLMVSGYDRYFQIVKCFRDEDLRADRQPEFTQLDCEMAFVDQEDILSTFEALAKHTFKTLKNIDLGHFPRMTYDDAMANYGSDKPDIRFGMKFKLLNDLVKNKGFQVFDSAEKIMGICAVGAGDFSRKQLDALTDFVCKPQIGSKGLVYVKYNQDGTLKSSVDKFYSQDELQKWAKTLEAKPGDLMLILAGNETQTLKALCELRLHMGSLLGLRDKNTFAPLWVVDFPLLEWSPEHNRHFAMHHPFTSPKKEDMALLKTAPGKVKANAYDLVINGVELGGGSIRIHDRELQNTLFKVLGFTEEESQNQFGFLLDAFEYGAPPHGGIAFGLDRWAALLSGSDSIRDFIAFPKNNSGRDVMIDAPSKLDKAQLDELYISPIEVN